jgi:SRSO17 transposase
VEAEWEVDALRAQRIALTRQAIGDQPIVLCIDETGDKKKGKSTDYVARQSIGNLGKVENGVVSVNAYGVVDNIAFPLYF